MEQTEKGKCFQEIGHIVIEFARLESILKKCFLHISYSIDVLDYLILFAKISFKDLQDLFYDYIGNKYHDKVEILNKAKKIKKMLIEANNIRNDILHSYWLSNSLKLDKPLYKHRMSKKFESITRGQIIEIGYSELNEKVKYITNTIDELVKFMRENIYDKFRE